MKGSFPESHVLWADWIKEELQTFRPLVVTVLIYKYKIQTWSVQLKLLNLCDSQGTPVQISSQGSNLSVSAALWGHLCSWRAVRAQHHCSPQTAQREHFCPLNYLVTRHLQPTPLSPPHVKAEPKLKAHYYFQTVENTRNPWNQRRCYYCTTHPGLALC